MPNILELLNQEREQLKSLLTQALMLLGGESVPQPKRRGRPPKAQLHVLENAPAWVGSAPKKARKKRIFTAKQKREQGERMKKYWAEKRKGAKAKASSKPKSKAQAAAAGSSETQS